MNSVQIVEDFFGLPIDSPLFSVPPEMPARQLVELAWRLEDFGRSLEHSHAEGQAVLAGTYASDNVILSGARHVPAASMSEVKLQLLLCERAVVPDLLLAWGFDVSLDDALGPLRSAVTQRRLEAAIEHIRPLATAIRRGYLVPVPPVDKHHVAARDVSTVKEASLRNVDFLGTDPVTRHLLQTRFHISDFQLQEGFTGAELLRSVEDELHLGVDPALVSGLLKVYGIGSIEALAEVTHFLSFCSTLGSQPMAARPDVTRHLLWATALTAGSTGLPERSETVSLDALGEAAASPAFDPGFAVAMPSLSGATIKQLTALRSDEEVWSRLRSALTEAALATGELRLSELDYLTFVDAVRQRTQDIVQPAVDQLHRDLRRAKWQSLAFSWSGAAIIRLAVHGVALILPATAIAAGPASQAAKHGLERSRASHISNLETATTLMLSFSLDAHQSGVTRHGASA